MNQGSRLTVTLLIASLSILMAADNSPILVHASPVVPMVGIWSEAYHSSVISDPSLSPNSTIVVDINVTNAPALNGYDLTLYYDPGFLKPSFIDVRAGFTHPFIGADDLSLGSIHLAVVDVGANLTGSSGTLVRISFEVVGLGVSPLTLAAAMTAPSLWAQSWTQVVFGFDEIQVLTVDGYFSNVADGAGPVASFTFSPISPIIGDTVIFDASSSFDPDNNHDVNHGIAWYVWDFGDGYTDITTYPADTHRYAYFFAPNNFGFYGNFSVRLTVIDSDNGFRGMVTQRLEVSPIVPPTDNFLVQTNTLPRNVVAGTDMTYSIIVTTVGAFSAAFSLRVTELPSVRNGPTTSIPSRLNLHGSNQLTATLDVHTATNTPPGRYAFIIAVTGNGILHYGIVFLILYPN
jgi:hypothetical protein